jgi:hypothetical protein
MIWSGKPYFNVPIANKESVEKQMPVRVRILTDTKKTLVDLFDTVQVAAGVTKQYAMTTPDKLAPGFYRAICYVNGVNVRSFAFGIDPFDIISAPDKQPDFDAYWQGVKDQLAAVDMNPVLKEITEKNEAAMQTLNHLESKLRSVEDEPRLVRITTSHRFEDATLENARIDPFGGIPAYQAAGVAATVDDGNGIGPA